VEVELETVLLTRRIRTPAHLAARVVVVEVQTLQWAQVQVLVFRELQTLEVAVVQVLHVIGLAVQTASTRGPLAVMVGRV
jgi:hypothetical protein